MSIWIEAVAAVKLFKVEEPKDSQPAAASQGIQMDMAFGASTADEVR